MNLRHETMLAAMDSIITRFNPVGDRLEKGSIIFENEMYRVMGYDAAPNMRIFEKNPRLFTELVNDTITSMRRISKEHPNADIYALFWVGIYQAAFYKAIYELNVFPKNRVSMVLRNPSVMGVFRSINYILHLLRNSAKGRLILYLKDEKQYSYWIKYSKKCLNLFGVEFKGYELKYYGVKEQF